MQRLEVSGAVRPIYGSLGVKRLRMNVVLGYWTTLNYRRLCKFNHSGNEWQEEISKFNVLFFFFFFFVN